MTSRSQPISSTDIHLIIAATRLHIQHYFLIVVIVDGGFFSSPLHEHMVYVCHVLCVPATDASGNSLRVSMWHVTMGAGTDRHLPQILSVSETHWSTVISDLYSRAALTCSCH